MSLKVVISAAYKQVLDAFNRVNQGADQTGKKLKSIGGKGIFGEMSGGLKNLLGMFGVGWGAKYAIDQFRQLANELDHIGKTSRNLDMNTREFQAYAFAAERSGMSTDQLQMALRKLTKLSAEAAGGNASALKKFALLGISPDQLVGKSTAEQFELVADALNRVKDKAGIAQMFFEESGVAVVELAAHLKELKQEFYALGGGWSDSAIQAAENFNDSLTNCKNSLKAIVNELKMVEAAAAGLKMIENDIKYNNGYDDILARQNGYRRKIESQSKSDRRKSLNNFPVYGGAAAGTLGAVAGGVIGSIVSVIGSVVGAALGAALAGGVAYFGSKLLLGDRKMGDEVFGEAYEFDPNLFVESNAGNLSEEMEQKAQEYRLEAKRQMRQLSEDRAAARVSDGEFDNRIQKIKDLTKQADLAQKMANQLKEAEPEAAELASEQNNQLLADAISKSYEDAKKEAQEELEIQQLKYAGYEREAAILKEITKAKREAAKEGRELSTGELDAVAKGAGELFDTVRQMNNLEKKAGQPDGAPKDSRISRIPTPQELSDNVRRIGGNLADANYSRGMDIELQYAKESSLHLKNLNDKVDQIKTTINSAGGPSVVLERS